MNASLSNPIVLPPLRVGCVSYLNAKPLIHGFRSSVLDAELLLDVPSKLLDLLLHREADLALCPVIDFQVSHEPLVIVPVGGIGCAGETLTVRLFSAVPIEQVQSVRLDIDSHTSVMLAKILLDRLYDIRPEFVRRTDQQPAPANQAMLLIGDKVVNAAPIDEDYPHQLDLGECWRRLTGLPFVFATWLARPDTDLRGLPEALAQLRIQNADRLEEIIERHATALRWPHRLARRYLGQLLRYDMGAEQRQAIELFWQYAAEFEGRAMVRPWVEYADDPAHRSAMA